MLRTLGNASSRQHCRLASSSLARKTIAPATLRPFHYSRKQAQASPAPAKPEAPSPADQFMTTNNSYYVEEMQRLWKQDPSSVHSSWAVYFQGLSKGMKSQDAYQMPPSLMSLPIQSPPIDHTSLQSGESIDDHLKLQLLVRAYQVRGHSIAVLDPLGIIHPDLDPNVPEELTIEHYGWSEADLKREMRLGPGLLPNFVKAGVQKMTIGEVIDACKQTYCESILVEAIVLYNY
jgi:2-oxoglutarate dehydrogenase E1 component